MWKLRWECSIASFSRAAGLARLTRVVLADVVLQLLVPKFFHQLTVFCAAHECILHLPADLVSPITTKFLMNPSNFVNKLLERMSSIHSAPTLHVKHWNGVAPALASLCNFPCYTNTHSSKTVTASSRRHVLRHPPNTKSYQG